MIGVVISVMTMMTGLLLAIGLADGGMAFFGWLIAVVGLLALLGNVYVARRMR